VQLIPCTFLSSKSIQINDHDTALLKLINKYHSEFTTSGKTITYYLKRKNGYKEIKLPEIVVGENAETFIQIHPYNNSISYNFDYGTAYRGDGVFIK